MPVFRKRLLKFATNITNSISNNSDYKSIQSLTIMSVLPIRGALTCCKKFLTREKVFLHHQQEQYFDL